MSLSLLLHLDGTHGDTSTIDHSPSAHTVTVYNGASLANTQIKFGSTSLYLDGVNDYGEVTGTLADWDFGTGDFTIDLWVNVPSFATDQPLLAMEVDANNYWYLKVKAGYGFWFEVKAEGTITSMYTAYFLANTWVHLAIVRAGSGISSLKFFKNGVYSAAKTIYSAMPSGQPIQIGKMTIPSTVYGNAYIDELRILKGEATWTTGFTVPVAAYNPPYYIDQEHKALFHLSGFVMAEYSALFKALIEAEHGAQINFLIDQEHAAPITFLINGEHATLFKAWIEHEHASYYVAWVEAEHGAGIFVTVHAEFASLQSLLELINQQSCALFNLLAFNPVDCEHAAWFNAVVEAEHSARLALMGHTDAEHATRVSSLVSIDAERSARLSLLTLNPVGAQYAALVRLGLPQVIDVTDSAILTHNGRKVEILSANVKQDEGDPFWSASVEIAEASDFATMAVDDDIELSLGADVYSLIIDGKEKSRSFGQVSLSITAVSPGARLAVPRAKPVTKTWPAVWAKTAAEEMAGQTLTWSIPNWLIPEGRLAVSEASPLDVIRQIAEAAGGVLQSNPDGSLVVRPLFPVSVPAWGKAAADAILTDDEHNLTASEMYRSPEIVNKVTIRDAAPGATQDQTEYEPDENDNMRGVLRVYPRPWRPIGVAHTGHKAVGLALIDIGLERKTELVEFKEGKASAGFPVYSIVSVQWQYANLGGVQASGNELTSAVAKYSLAWITYNSRRYSYRVSDTKPETIQFLVFNP